MKRVLVPLDGTDFSARILPDACRLAGADGVLILVHDTSLGRYSHLGGGASGVMGIEEAESYLREQAASLAAKGFRTEVHQTNLYDVSKAIDLAAQVYEVDYIACATHGHGPVGRLAHGSTAWRAVASSPVPVMLRHAESEDRRGVGNARRIMVPLDGSEFAARALPIAADLAREWNATLVLVRVIPTLPAYAGPFSATTEFGELVKEESEGARNALLAVAETLNVPVEVQTVSGSPIVDVLADAVDLWKITDIVLASHGHTGLTRVVVGSVADGLVHKVTCPVIVVPTHAVYHSSATVSPAHDREPVAIT
jgi:nucleotide-binding universal stress UspA family protein